MAAIANARRPVVILGIDVDPHRDVAAVRAFVDALGLPVFVTPKAKGLLPEDHPLFSASALASPATPSCWTSSGRRIS